MAFAHPSARPDRAYRFVNDSMSTRHNAIRLLADIAASSNDGASVEEVLQASLERVCGHMGWRAGRAFLRARYAAIRAASAPCACTLSSVSLCSQVGGVGGV